MTDSVKTFLDQYEWGYPFADDADYIDPILIQREIDRGIIHAENQRYYESIVVKQPHILEPPRVRFLGC